MTANLYDAAKRVLHESPLMVDTGHSTATMLWSMSAQTDAARHIGNGTVIGHSTNVGELISHIKSPAPSEDLFHDQYVRRNDKTSTMKVEFKNSYLQHMPGKIGARAQKLIKYNDMPSYADILAIYKHHLSNKDFLMTDHQQMIGGKQTWKRLVNDMHTDGYKLHIHTPDGISEVSPAYIKDHEDDIWGYDPKHEHTSVVITK